MNLQMQRIRQVFSSWFVLVATILCANGCTSNTIVRINTNPQGANIKSSYFEELNRPSNFEVSIPDKHFDEVDERYFKNSGQVKDTLTITKEGYRDLTQDIKITRHGTVSSTVYALEQLNTSITFKTQIVGEKTSDLFSYTEGAPASVKIQFDSSVRGVIPDDWPVSLGLLKFNTPKTLRCTEAEAEILQGGMRYIQIDMPDYTLQQNSGSALSSAQIGLYVGIQPGREVDTVMRFKPELTTLVVVTEDSGVNLEFDYGTGYEYIGTTAKASTDKDENFSGKFGFVCNFTAQEIKNLITEDTKTLHKPVKDISVPVITVKVRASLEHSGIDPRIRTINIQKGESIQVLIRTFEASKQFYIHFTSKPVGASVFWLNAPVRKKASDGTVSLINNPKKLMCTTDDKVLFKRTAEYEEGDLLPKDGDFFQFELNGFVSEKAQFIYDDSERIQLVHLVLQPTTAKPK